MNQDQVRLILGSPVLSNTFSDNEWIYVYSEQKGQRIKQNRKLIIKFQNHKIRTIETKD